MRLGADASRLAPVQPQHLLGVPDPGEPVQLGPGPAARVARDAIPLNDSPSSAPAARVALPRLRWVTALRR